MALGHVVTRGYGNGTLAGDPNLVAVRGYSIGAVVNVIPEAGRTIIAEVGDRTINYVRSL